MKRLARKGLISRSAIQRSSPLVLRTPIQKANAAKKTWTKVLDPLCRAVVFARDLGICQWCGKPATDWAHIISRRYWSVRWNLDNSLALCKGCHLKAHHRPLNFSAWFAMEFSDRYVRMLRWTVANPRAGKPDLAGTRLYLELEMKKYNPGAVSPLAPRPASSGRRASVRRPVSSEEA